MKKILLAFQFLTIIPVRVNGDVSGKEMAQSAAFFSFVGLFQGLLAASAALLSIKIFSPEITSILAILVLIISNGGFHLDGLADTFDALSVKSSRCDSQPSDNKKSDREKRLSVMKDSSTGAIGVVAITLAILLKFLLIKNLFLKFSLSTAFSQVLLMPVFSRWAMVPAMYHGMPARNDGLGRIFINNINKNQVIFSSAAAIILYLLVTGLRLRSIPDANALFLLLTIFSAMYIFSFLSAKFSEKKFGGLTGDILGAISEISEILFLTIVLIWRNS